MAEKEYIERASIYSAVSRHTNPYGKPTLDYESGVKVLEMIKREPAADVVEVVHARWINPKNGNATCSHCQFRQRGIYDDDNEQNFCGVCGAKMDGENYGKA